jgi:hypothetical protein
LKLFVNHLSTRYTLYFCWWANGGIYSSTKMASQTSDRKLKVSTENI